MALACMFFSGTFPYCSGVIYCSNKGRMNSVSGHNFGSDQTKYSKVNKKELHSANEQRSKAEAVLAFL